MDNNEARRQFKVFVEEHNLESCGARNVFCVGKSKWAYVADKNAVSFRQFYEDCDGLYLNGEFVHKSKLKISSCTRTTPSGIRAFNVTIA